MQRWQLLLVWSVHVTAILHHPRERRIPLSGVSLCRVQRSLDSGYANGIVHRLIENVTTEMTTNQTLQSSALLSTFGPYSLGKPRCLSSYGGTWCLLHTSLANRCLLDSLLSFCHRSLLTSAIIQPFWPRELPLTNIDFSFQSIPCESSSGWENPSETSLWNPQRHRRI